MQKLFDLVQARKLMEKYGIDVLVASSTDNFGYLTDYWTHYGKYFDIGWIGDPCLQMAVLPFEKNIEPFMYLVGQESDVEYVDPWIKDRRFYRDPGYGAKDEGDFFEVFSKIMKEKGLDKSRIGLELGYEGYTIEIASHKMIETLRRCLPNTSFVDASNLFRELRLIKTDEEMARIIKASEIIDRCLKATFEEVRGNMTESELEWILRRNLIEDRIDVILLNINFGEDDILRPTDKRLQEGDFIRIDLALKYKQYYGDVARSVVFKKPSTKIKHMFDSIHKAHDKVVESIKLGSSCSEIFNIAKKSLKESGYTYQPPIIGHGTGISVHEAPYLGENNMTIQPGMAFTVEILLKPGKGSWIGTEDMIICDKKGCRDITTFTKDLIVL